MTGSGHNSRSQIDHEFSAFEDRDFFFGPGFSLGCTKAGEQLRGAEWLSHIIFCARIEGRDFPCFIVTNRENQNRDLAPLAQSLEHIEAVHVR